MDNIWDNNKVCTSKCFGATKRQHTTRRVLRCLHWRTETRSGKSVLKLRSNLKGKQLKRMVGIGVLEP